MNIRLQFFKGILVAGTYQYAMQAVGFVSQALVARYVLPEAHGLVALILVFSNFVAIFSDSGISYAVIRSDFDKASLKAIHNLGAVIGLFLTVLLALLAWPVSVLYNDPQLVLPTLVISVTFTIQGTFLVSRALAQKEHRFGFSGRVLAAGYLIQAIMAVGMAIAGFSYWSLVIPPLFNFSFQAWRFNLRYISQFPFSGFTELRSAFQLVKSVYGNVSGYNLINYWARNADNLLIGYYHSNSALGIYSKAYFLFMFPLNSINSIINQVLLPTLQRLVAEGKNVELQYQKVENGIGLLIIPFAMSLILLPDFLVRTIWGEDWLEVIPFLPYFGTLLLSQAVIYPVSLLFVTLKKERTLFHIGIFNSVALVAAIWAGVVFSMELLVLAYTLVYLLLIVPVFVIAGYKKAFGFSTRRLLMQWGFRIGVSLGLVAAIWLDQFNWVVFLAAAYTVWNAIIGVPYVKEIFLMIKQRKQGTSANAAPKEE